MHRIDGPGHASNMFTEGNATLGIPRTLVTDDWANAVQEEPIAVILAAGLALNKLDNTQLLQAVRLLIRGDRSAAPIGAILAVTGTFSAANNGGVYNEIGVAVGSAWKLCDGSQVADAESPFDGRYVPKLDDGRFLRGNASGGTIGGQAILNPSVAFAAAGNYTPGGSMATHSHSGTTAMETINPGFGGAATASPDAHSHAFSTNFQSPTFNGNAVARSTFFLNSNVNIEPVYLDVKLYMRIK